MKNDNNIPKFPRDKTIPLSFAQQSFLSVEKYFPGNSFSNLIRIVHINGDLECSILKDAITHIINRHEILRTYFPNLNDNPQQIAAEAGGIQLDYHDLTKTPKDTSSSDLSGIITHIYNGPFNFQNGPLYRTALIKIHPNEHILIIVIHHILCDEWSFELLNNELINYYSATATGMAPSFPELTIQYADYSIWQRTQVAEGKLKKETAYWLKKLSGGILPRMSFPLTTQPPEKPLSFSSQTHHFCLAKKLSDDLKHSSQVSKCTLFMTLLSTLKIVLFKLLKSEDIRVGTLMSNRGQQQLQPLIGLFINTLVLRTSLSKHQSLKDALHKVRQTVLEGYENHALPFEYLTTLFPNNNLSELFNVMFIFNKATKATQNLDSLTLNTLDAKELFNTGTTITSCEMIFSASEQPEGIQCSITYKPDCVSPKMILQTEEYFTQVAQSIAYQPNTKIGDKYF